MPAEKELDLALASALESDPAFVAWLVGHTKFANSGYTFHSCRSDHPWGTHPFPVTDRATGTTTISKRQSETDVLLILKDDKGGFVGVHIENKIGAGKFTEFQPDMYSHRAAHWVGNPRYGGYTDFDTVLLAPDVFQRRNAEQARLFGCFVSLESVAHFIPAFQGVVGAA